MEVVERQRNIETADLRLAFEVLNGESSPRITVKKDGKNLGFKDLTETDLGGLSECSVSIMGHSLEPKQIVFNQCHLLLRGDYSEATGPHFLSQKALVVLREKYHDILRFNSIKRSAKK